LLTDISESVAEIDMYEDPLPMPEEESGDINAGAEEVQGDAAEESSADTATLEMINLDTSTLDIPEVSVDPDLSFESITESLPVTEAESIEE
jgi:hypothetical protein